MGTKGFRKVPASILAQIQALDEDLFQVGAIRRFGSPAEAASRFSHLSVTADQDGLHVPASTLPPISSGRWSRWNIEGRIIVRRDLPKVLKDFGWWAPNFGDSSRGEHWVSQFREIWQREVIYGQHLHLLGDHVVYPGEVQVGYRVDALFRRQAYAERDLVFALSLLQENVGAVGVVGTEITQDEWLAQTHVDWEILPVGTWGERERARVLRRLGLSTGDRRGEVMSSRFTAIMANQPTDVLIGTSGFARYLGYRFRDDLVAFENLDYGNALYVMYESWAEVSKRTRTDLLQNGGADFDRIVHRDGWERRLAAVLKTHGHPERA